MKTSITTRLASFAAALAITFTTVHALASYALPQAADPVLASACQCR
jgi:hypothetical protein